MSGRKITYDEIQIEILARHDLTAEQRHEMLAFIRDFKQTVIPELLEKSIPDHIKPMMTVKVS